MTIDWNDFSDLNREKILYSPKELKNLAHIFGHGAKKSLGQNYLIDKNIVGIIGGFAQKIAEENNLKRILEIGCGLGSLTNELLLRKMEVTGVEIDRRSVHFLEKIFENEIKEKQFFILQKSILDIFLEDLEKISSDEAFLILGNLPYNIASPILFHCFEHFGERARGFIFMVQKEMALRINARCGTSDYSRLTVMCQLFCQRIRNVVNVSRNSFYPSPKIESSVVFFELKKDMKEIKYDIFSNLVKRAFNMRRKKVISSLMQSEMGLLDELKLQEALSYFDFGNKRAQELSFEDYLELYHRYISL